MKIMLTGAVAIAVYSLPVFGETIVLKTSRENLGSWSVSEYVAGDQVTLAPRFAGSHTRWSPGEPAISIPAKHNDGFWTADTYFTLPEGATRPKLVVKYLGIDDRAVVLLNGAIITDGGNNGPGAGAMQFTDPGSNESYTFSHGYGPQNVVVKEGFVSGSNHLQIIVNNTFNGIHEGIVAPTNLKGSDPTDVGFTAVVTYQPALDSGADLLDDLNR